MATMDPTQNTPQETDETPYDAIWTWVASATIAYGSLTFLYLSTGAPSLIPTAKAMMQDDVKVAAAFWGALVCSIGLTALGFLAIVFVRSKYARPGQIWPRLKLIEGKTRSPFVVRIALAVTLLTPLAAMAASLISYHKNSRISEWNATEPLGSGFLASRVAAYGTDCPSQPCFRMAPMDGVQPYSHQWFYWSDPVLFCATLGALVAWLVFALIARRAE